MKTIHEMFSVIVKEEIILRKLLENFRGNSGRFEKIVGKVFMNIRGSIEDILQRA